MTEYTRDTVAAVLAANPGISSFEVSRHLPHFPAGTISSSLSTLKAERRICVSGHKAQRYDDGKIRTVPVYHLTACNKNRKLTAQYPNAVFRPVPVESSEPVGLEAVRIGQLETAVAELENRVRELKAWKANAIQQYPELNVSAVLLRARSALAQGMREHNNGGEAAKIMAGDWDDTVVMKALLSAVDYAEVK